MSENVSENTPANGSETFQPGSEKKKNRKSYWHGCIFVHVSHDRVAVCRVCAVHAQRTGPFCLLCRPRQPLRWSEEVEEVEEVCACVSALFTCMAACLLLPCSGVLMEGQAFWASWVMFKWELFLFVSTHKQRGEGSVCCLLQARNNTWTDVIQLTSLHVHRSHLTAHNYFYLCTFVLSFLLSSLLLRPLFSLFLCSFHLLTS